MAKLYQLFSEMPYGAALSDEFLSTRCSNCFVENSIIPCEDECNTIVYCNEKCRDVDQPFHKYECLAFKKIGSTKKIDQFTRMLARIVTRQQIDKGIAHLSDDFPSNISDRCMSDLISHQSDIEKCKLRNQNMLEIWKEFSQVYEGTPIMAEREIICRMYCVMMINCFSVSGQPDIRKGHESALGVAFYLNTSRFNHSCRPDLHVDFDNARLIIQFVSANTDPKSIAEDRLSLTKSAQKLNGLTINYGYAHSFNCDSFFPIRSQRRTSLKFGYYFHCQCVLCSDERAANLEEHAAALECSQCAEPFVWKKVARSSLLCCISPPQAGSKYICRKSCRCSMEKNEVDDVKMYVRSMEPDTSMANLEKEWHHAMSPRIHELYAQEIIEACEPVLIKARQYWHRSGNLRLAQLNERMFISCRVLVQLAWKKKETPDYHLLKMAVETGEAVIAWCNRQPANAAYRTVLAAYGYRVARLYENSALINSSALDAKMAAYWYRYAASIWADRGDEVPKFFNTLLQSAEQIENQFVSAGDSK